MTPSEQIDDLLRRAGTDMPVGEALREIDLLRQVVRLTDSQERQYNHLSKNLGVFTPEPVIEYRTAYKTAKDPEEPVDDEDEDLEEQTMDCEQDEETGEWGHRDEDGDGGTPLVDKYSDDR